MRTGEFAFYKGCGKLLSRVIVSGLLLVHGIVYIINEPEAITTGSPEG